MADLRPSCYITAASIIAAGTDDESMEWAPKEGDSQGPSAPGSLSRGNSCEKLGNEPGYFKDRWMG